MLQAQAEVGREGGALSPALSGRIQARRGGGQPLEGDAVLFYGGGVGHVALVKGVDPARGQLTVVEENWSPTGEATLPLYGGSTVGIRDSAYGSYVVASWLHSPRNAA